MLSSNTTAGVQRLLPAAATAIIAGVASVLGSYAVAGFTRGFVVAPISSAVTRAMPGPVVTFAIQTFGSFGEQLNLLLAIGLTTGSLAALAFVGLAVGRRIGRAAGRAIGAGDSRGSYVAGVTGALLAGALPWGLTTVLTGDPVLALGAGVPAGLVVGVEHLLGVAATTDGSVGAIASPGRRRIVEGVVGALAVGGLGLAFGRERNANADRSLDGDAATNASTPSGDDEPGSNDQQSNDQQQTETPSERDRLLSDARERSFDVDGVEPLVSRKFYTVDIDAVPPNVAPDEWTLSVTGAVEEELTLDYEDLTAMDAQDRFKSLRCVGERLNGDKLDNALWTGVPIQDIVDRAGPKSDCECVMLHAADDYFEEFPLAALSDAMAAYGMNGESLPVGHGYPVRALVPGHWGEINVKWLTEIEVLEKTAEGYWEKRGWHGTGPVNTVAKIEAVDERQDTVRVAGRAYAGTRGVQAVEVSTDGGTTWNDARLSDPLPATAPTPDADAGETPFGEDVLRQWLYEYDNPGTKHEVVVRAVDGTGTVQPKDESRAFPSGPTGWVSKTITP